MYKVLVIGCGNIGAQYDINNIEIQTHVKAWDLNKSTTVSIFDIDSALASQIGNQYQCEIINNTSIETLAKFDIVSICTPTSTHFKLLNDALTAGVKTIICEKPISNDVDEMNRLKEIYNSSRSKILVNYIRRFQPDYLNLKLFIQNNLKGDQLTNISVRYQRGFINNCSHAMDLLEFLIDKEIVLEQIKIHNSVFDQFENDSTLSLMGFWDTVNVNILGLGNVLFSHFEIDLYFKNHKILIKNAGNIVEVYKAETGQKTLAPLILQEKLSKKDCLKNYMVPVTNEAIALIENTDLHDNFLSSIKLNLKMLNYKKN